MLGVYYRLKNNELKKKKINNSVNHIVLIEKAICVEPFFFGLLVFLILLKKTKSIGTDQIK